MWPLLANGDERTRMIADLSSVRASLGEPGAAGRVAQVALGRLLPQLDVSAIPLPAGR